MKNVSRHALSLFVAFVIGCAAAPLVIPPLSAQGAAARGTTWEYVCVAIGDLRNSEAYENAREAGDDRVAATGRAMSAYGADGWEFVVADGSGTCFKRPR